MPIFELWSETAIAYGERQKKLIGTYKTYPEAILAQEQYKEGTWETLSITKKYE